MGRRKIKELEDLILRYKKSYYRGQAEISDEEYDELEDELRAIAPESAVLNMVGAEANSVEKVRHHTKMLSLNKTYLPSELESWRGERDVVSLYKIDGSSCSLIYRNGRLEVGKTRGDGQYGEDITKKAFWIDDIPKELDVDGEVRGEIYCQKKNFDLLADEMESRGLERPSSLRNIVAGLLGRKENIELVSYLSFFAFEVISDDVKLKSEHKRINFLKSLGFQVPPHALHKGVVNFDGHLNKAQSFMERGDYLIDGLVFVYDDTNIHKDLGSTAHHPRFKLAFKFRGENRNTHIEEILWPISRNGHLIPVAVVKPTRLSGAVISRVTLHHYGLAKEHGLKKGDEIKITRSGEVIPKFVSVVRSSPQKFQAPGKCHVCGTKLIKEDIHLICPNLDCLGRTKESILFFIQKIGIENLSSKRLEDLFEKKLVSKITDLYRLNKQDLLKLNNFKDRMANKILAEIEKSKEVSLPTFLSALGLAGGGYNTCEKVVQGGHDTMDKIKKITVESLCQLESFAEKSSKDFVDSLRAKWPLVEELIQVGVRPREGVAGAGNTTLSGKKFAITGTLSQKRSKIETKLRNHQAIVASSVSKGVDYLVSNDVKGASSKLKKAKELGIPIISEDELNAMMR